MLEVHCTHELPQCGQNQDLPHHLHPFTNAVIPNAVRDDGVGGLNNLGQRNGKMMRDIGVGGLGCWGGLVRVSFGNFWGW